MRIPKKPKNLKTVSKSVHLLRRLQMVPVEELDSELSLLTDEKLEAIVSSSPQREYLESLSDEELEGY